jgi:hypothetical protein|eukprot:Tamp_21805.p2 GENE.Tamp_21805~~Tamp_21805.p2  ORF type:complete len:162 (-),score=29.61 Tamp_21805:591-1076(-)
MRTCVSIAAALALASCVDAFCASPSVMMPRTAAPLASVSMVGKDYYHGQAADRKRREAAKRAPYGGYNPETRALQSEPSALYPVPTFEAYGGYAPKKRAVHPAPAAVVAPVDGGASGRAQREIDELRRIKEDFMARLDAAGARSNIVHGPGVSAPTVAGLR